jgi:Sigma 54 modulation protein / S30EA ribosomal protein
MKLPVQITFRNIPSSGIVEEWIREEAAKLEALYDRPVGCHVAVEVPHRHHRRGSPYHIRVDLTVPGGEIVVKRAPNLSKRSWQMGELRLGKHLELDREHKNLRPVINETFKTVARRLKDYARRQRGEVKSHPLQVARVSKNLGTRTIAFK